MIKFNHFIAHVCVAIGTRGEALENNGTVSVLCVPTSDKCDLLPLAPYFQHFDSVALPSLLLQTQNSSSSNTHRQRQAIVVAMLRQRISRGSVC